jgi:hypothetical protein
MRFEKYISFFVFGGTEIWTQCLIFATTWATLPALFALVVFLNSLMPWLAWTTILFRLPVWLGWQTCANPTCSVDHIVLDGRGHLRCDISVLSLCFYLANRGHGTYMGEEKLIASVAGSVERVNKLICVKALKTRWDQKVCILSCESVLYNQVLSAFPFIASPGYLPCLAAVLQFWMWL